MGKVVLTNHGALQQKSERINFQTINFQPKLRENKLSSNQLSTQVTHLGRTHLHGRKRLWGSIIPCLGNISFFSHCCSLFYFYWFEPAVGGSHHLEVVEVDTAEVLGNLLLAAEVDTQTHLPAEPGGQMRICKTKEVKR